ncbi:MAG: DUF167 domain-containing protein [Candidatus Omnitrophota bacterium]|nr:DUF167 domain-containing protein [Candidatus Omnitrophota bacterium]
MKITVRVRPNSKEAAVEKLGDKEFILRVKAPAREGMANEAAIGLLSEYLKIPKSRIRVVKGHKSKFKLMEII